MPWTQRQQLDRYLPGTIELHHRQAFFLPRLIKRIFHEGAAVTDALRTSRLRIVQMSQRRIAVATEMACSHIARTAD